MLSWLSDEYVWYMVHWYMHVHGIGCCIVCIWMDQYLVSHSVIECLIVTGYTKGVLYVEIES